MKHTRKLILALTLIFTAIAISSAALAVTYILQESNHVSLDVTTGNVQVPIVLSVNGTSRTDLDTFVLTAITSAQGNGLTAKFYDGTTLLGQQTIANGQASITLAPGTLNIGHHDIATKP